MDNDAVFQGVLSVFAHYGFRKTSMSDLAQAANVSRQTLYNRFKTKDAVLDWAVENYVRQAKTRALSALHAPHTSMPEQLCKAFSEWVGEMVPVLRNSPHGAAIMDLGVASLQRTDIDHQMEFENELSRFLLSKGACETAREADEKTFLLIMASKGLFLKTSSSDDFNADMKRIINSAIPSAIS